ncbi:hypothetical protein R3X25_05745 [Lutibacter sp. TH_r2]|uniref:hypothetical protein n=1 Tax=Lutibacter sp. TH_r2 TaxID=3082083 RepID=UPI002953E856|nr:hypothetical protein [Lutibacter sp. TH_r2]MDV7186779.1 hypothetical protein [Lutibacter sp. TH_r2]
MKKFIYLIMAFSLTFISCDPMDDVYDELDAEGTTSDPRSIIGSDEYTLTDDDYETLGLDYGSFSSEDDAKTMLPDFISSNSKYDYWAKNSSVLIGYQLYVGSAPGVSDYTSADSYELADADYANAGADAATYSVFTAASPADLNLPSILESNIDAPVSGDIVLAKYKYAEEPSDPAVIYTMVNDDYQLIVDLVANNSDPAISSLVSSYGDSELYTGASAYYGNFDIRLSKRVGQADYDALTTEEEQIAFVDERVQIGVQWFLKAKYPNAVPEINGQTVNYVITYKTFDDTYTTLEPTVIYKCTAGGSDPEFELVDGPGEDVVYQASTITENRGDFYSYTGSEWEKVSGVYFMGSGDFDSMGEESGQPGKYNNFGSSTPPGDYLPAFLNIKYPYALEGDEMIVIYDYYSSSSGAQIRGDLYTKADGVWSGFESTISTTLQFGFDGTNWVPDNTIKYTLVSADYAYMSTELEGNEFFSNVNLGSLASYNDYDYNWSDEQILYSLDLLLDYLDPNAEEGQKYLITYLLYDNGLNDITRNLIKTNGEWVWDE